MDFIVGLLRMQVGYDTIWVIKDRLTKVAHFNPIKMTYSRATLANLYMSRIVCLHGVHKQIMPIEDPSLHLNFGRSFMNRWTLSSISAQHIIHRLTVKQRGPTRYSKICSEPAI
jgi:hypothetical protein